MKSERLSAPRSGTSVQPAGGGQQWAQGRADDDSGGCLQEEQVRFSRGLLCLAAIGQAWQCVDMWVRSEGGPGMQCAETGPGVGGGQKWGGPTRGPRGSQARWLVSQRHVGFQRWGTRSPGPSTTLQTSGWHASGGGDPGGVKGSPGPFWGICSGTHCTASKTMGSTCSDRAGRGLGGDPEGLAFREKVGINGCP